MSSLVVEPSPKPSEIPKRLGLPSSRIVWLGLILIGLGVVRGSPDGFRFANYFATFGFRLLFRPSSVGWQNYSGIAWAAWPVFLGIAMVRTRSPKLLAAAAVSCLVLGLERATTLSVGVAFDSGWPALYQGSYDRSLEPVLPQGQALGTLIGAMTFWLGLAFACFWSMPRRPKSKGGESFKEKKARRKASARIWNAGTTIFATAVLALASWTTYITVLERLPWVRSLVIGTPKRWNRPFRQFVDTPAMRKGREAERLFIEAQGLSTSKKYFEARKAYISAVNRYEDLMGEYPDETYYRRQFALAANNLSWFLATCPDEKVRHANSAVVMGKKAVAAIPNDGNSLNTLAVALFRVKDFDAAAKTFEESMNLRDGGDSFDWFFLAQIESQKNHPIHAKSWYDKAVSWRVDNLHKDAELYRFHVEAAEQLKLPKPQDKPAEADEEVKPSGGQTL